MATAGIASLFITQGSKRVFKGNHFQRLQSQQGQVVGWACPSCD